MNLKELARYLSVSPVRLAPYLRSRGKKKIPARKIRGKWEISPEGVHKWLLDLYEKKVAQSQPSQANARAKGKWKISPESAKDWLLNVYEEQVLGSTHAPHRKNEAKTTALKAPTKAKNARKSSPATD